MLLSAVYRDPIEVFLTLCLVFMHCYIYYVAFKF